MYRTDMELDNETNKKEAHVRTIEKNKDGNLIIYDAQSGTVIEDEEYVKDYFNTWGNKNSKFKPTTLRIDDKIFNPYYINDVVVGI